MLALHMRLARGAHTRCTLAAYAKCAHSAHVAGALRARDACAAHAQLSRGASTAAPTEGLGRAKNGGDAD